MELATPMTQGCDGGLITWISAKPTDWTPEVNCHISWIMAEKICIMRRTSRSSLSRVLSTRSSCSTSPTSPTSLWLWKFLCPATIREWEYAWASTRRPVTNPVTGRQTSTERPVTAWMATRRGATGKEFTPTSWKTEIAKCKRARTTWTPCKRRTSEAIPRAAKFGKTDNRRAQSLNWDLWIGKQSPTRYRGKIWQLKDPWWNRTSQDRHGITPGFCEVDHGIIEKSKSTLHRSIFLTLLNEGMLNRGEVLCITVAVDQSTVKIDGNDKNLPSQIEWDCWIAVRWIKEGTFE